MTTGSILRGAGLLGVAIAPLLVALAAALTACPPTQPPPTRGTVRVAFRAAPSNPAIAWRADQLEQLTPYVNRELDATGYDFVVVDADMPADVLVFTTPGPLGENRCGAYVTGTNFVEVDTAFPCAAGYDILKRAVGHELVHWLLWQRFAWAGHLCTWAVNDPVPPLCHPTLRCDRMDCLLSPAGVTATGDGPSFTEVWTPGVNDPTLAPEDLALIDHCFTTRRCVP